jgi:hypothetical protein
MDVFIDSSEERKGCGKALMREVTTHVSLGTIYRWALVTEDAHGLYEQFESTSLDKAEIYMEKIVKVD